MEVEAAQSVYGDDCVVIESYPPHLRICIKPRTADVSSQQFVEAVIGIQANSQYPKEPPLVYLMDVKGLDEQRQTHLISSIRDKACELSSCFMLVALCEEAYEKLSSMNHPDGNCPFCLFPLVSEDDHTERLPFMKLMSCFHVFHSECIIRWWDWLQTENKNTAKDASSVNVHLRNTGSQQVEESEGNCPVCRKVFYTKDFEHVLDLVGTYSSQLNVDKTEVKDDEKLLDSDLEKKRRDKFEATLKLQQENCRLIGSKADNFVLPGITPGNTVTSSNQASTLETTAQPQINAETNSSNSSNNRPSSSKHRNPATAETNSSSSLNNKPSTSKHRNSSMRKQKEQNSRKQVRLWVRKENGGAAD